MSNMLISYCSLIIFVNEVIMGSNQHIIQNIIKSQNGTSASNSIIEILAPLQFTLASCTLEKQQSYVNFLLASPKDSFYYHFSTLSEIRNFNSRPSHHHNYYELLIVLDGEVKQKIEGIEYIFHTGDCCLMNRNIYHKEMFTANANVLFIGLSEELVTIITSQSNPMYFSDIEIPSQNPILSFMINNLHHSTTKEYLYFTPAITNTKWFNYLHECTDQILREIMYPSLGSTFLINGLILGIMNYLSDTSVFHLSPIKVATDPDYLLFSRISYIMEDSYGRITRHELEKKLNYSGNYLNLITQKYSGMCIFDYGMKYCMKRAADLLTNSNLSISDIMNDLRFNNATHFYNCFKKEYALTPKQYRLKNSSKD